MWKFPRPVGYTTAAVQPGKKKITKRLTQKCSSKSYHRAIGTLCTSARVQYQFSSSEEKSVVGNLSARRSTAPIPTRRIRPLGCAVPLAKVCIVSNPEADILKMGILICIPFLTLKCPNSDEITLPLSHISLKVRSGMWDCYSP